MCKPIAVLFGNIKGNLGDFAILQAVLMDVARHFPDREIHVYPHGHLPVDPVRLNLFIQKSDVKFTIKDGLYRSNDLKMSSLFRIIKNDRLARRIKIHLLSRKIHSELANHHQYEMYFLVGGDHWCGNKLTIAMFGTLGAITRSGADVLAYPFSINSRVLTYLSPHMLRISLQAIKPPLNVRDSISSTFLSDLGLESKLTPDCVYSLFNEVKSIQPNILRNKGRIVLSVTKNDRTNARESNRIIVEELLKNWDAENLELLTTTWTEDENELKALSEEYNIALRVPLTWQDLVSELASSSLVVTNRLHALILGSMSKTALLPVGDRKKSLSFARDSKLSDFGLWPEDITVELVRRCVQKREEIVGKLDSFSRNSCMRFESPVKQAIANLK